MKVSQRGFEINLQSLLDHTIHRLFKDPTVSLPFQKEPYNMRFIIKYGCDGSSSQSTYKQKKNDPDIVDESIFTASMVSF